MSKIINEDNGTIKIISDDNKKFAICSKELVEDCDQMWGFDIPRSFAKFFDSRQDILEDGQYIVGINNEFNDKSDKIKGMAIRITKKDVV